MTFYCPELSVVCHLMLIEITECLTLSQYFFLFLLIIASKKQHLYLIDKNVRPHMQSFLRQLSELISVNECGLLEQSNFSK